MTNITHFSGADSRKRHRAALLAAVAIALSACQSGQRNEASPSGKSAALLTMEQVAIAAHKCWFASKDPAFKPYRMANELNSYSGKPRFLLVPAKNYEAKPLLVVQAEGSSRSVETFGPLLSDSLGPRISADIGRWASGDSACGGQA
jgi:hypothetical protein